MKNIAVKTVLLSLSILVISCKKENVVSTPDQVATTSEGVKYEVDSTASKVEWKGYKLLKSESTSHIGTLKFSEGMVTLKDNKLESGKFVVDIKSLQNIDLREGDGKMAQMLEDHLKSADFFDVEKHPTASFEVTKVSAATEGDYNTVLDGNLTIKGITKPLSILANVTVEGEEVTIATENKDINRQDFGINFKSPAENGVIKDEITLQILVKAKQSK